MTRFFLLIGLLALTTGCGALISPQQELKIGSGVHEELKKQYTLVDPSDPLAQWAKEFVKPMEAASAEFRNPSEIGGYKVAVIADDTLVNAFAAPGGYTYIATGLILQAQSCAEIAGVMGHELAHVTQKHGVKSLETAMATQAIAEMLLGEGSISSQAAQSVLRVLQSTKFSRDDESESDEVGLQISAKSGYNPYGLAEFFRKLLGSGGAGVLQFLSSHPATDGRIASVKSQIKARYGARYSLADVHNGPCKTKMKLDAVKARINAKKYKVMQ
ncbi:MAG: putative Zn-dependent protease [Bradymonadia bacterium]|jgi:predicted Zn-dependent protease